MIEHPLVDHGLMIVAQTPFIGAFCARLRDKGRPDDGQLTHTYLAAWIHDVSKQLVASYHSPVQTAYKAWILADETERLHAANRIIDLALAAGQEMARVAQVQQASAAYAH